MWLVLPTALAGYAFEGDLDLTDETATRDLVAAHGGSIVGGSFGPAGWTTTAHRPPQHPGPQRHRARGRRAVCCGRGLRVGPALRRVQRNTASSLLLAMVNSARVSPPAVRPVQSVLSTFQATTATVAESAGSIDQLPLSTHSIRSSSIST